MFKGNIVVIDNSKHLEEDEAKKKFDSLAKTYIDKFVNQQRIQKERIGLENKKYLKEKVDD